MAVLKLVLEHYNVLNVLTQEPPTGDRLTSVKKKSLKDRNLIVHCIADNVLVKKPIAKELLDEETWEETGHWYALSSTGKWVKAFRNY